MAWGVVATVSEPDALVLAFVATCLARGAAEVRLFLDRPQPSLEARLARIQSCIVTACDEVHWAAVPGGRPWAPDQRQRSNLQRAYDASTLDWILHVDADEMLHGAGDVGEALAALPALVDFALVPVAERVYLGPPDPLDIFDGAFRRPCGPRRQAEVDAIDGPAAPCLREGMTCYVGGKGFLRTGRGLAVGIHAPEGLAPDRRARLDGFLILHFDGLTPRSWAWKKRRRLAQQPGWQAMASSARRNQMAAVAASGGDEEGPARLYLALRQLDPVRAAALDGMGLILRPNLDVGAALAAFVPGPMPDLSVEAFDQTQPGYEPITRWWRVRARIRRLVKWARPDPAARR